MEMVSINPGSEAFLSPSYSSCTRVLCQSSAISRIALFFNSSTKNSEWTKKKKTSFRSRKKKICAGYDITLTVCGTTGNAEMQERRGKKPYTENLPILFLFFSIERYSGISRFQCVWIDMWAFHVHPNGCLFSSRFILDSLIYRFCLSIKLSRALNLYTSQSANACSILSFLFVCHLCPLACALV